MNLESLNFGFSFNQSLDQVILPEHLRSLAFAFLEKSFSIFFFVPYYYRPFSVCLKAIPKKVLGLRCEVQSEPCGSYSPRQPGEPPLRGFVQSAHGGSDAAKPATAFGLWGSLQPKSPGGFGLIDILCCLFLK